MSARASWLRSACRFSDQRCGEQAASEAISSLSVPTLGGAVDLKIPPDSDTGRKLRLRGRGLPGTPPGDQIVELEVTAPRADTDEQRKAYAALGKAFGNA